MSEPPLVIEALPDLSSELQRLLEAEGEAALAAEVPVLRIVDRCRCGDDFCAMFYTVSKPSGAWGEGHETIPLIPGIGDLNVDVVSGHIVAVEVLFNPSAKKRLLRACP